MSKSTWSRNPEPTGGVELVNRIFDRVVVDPVTGCANWTGASNARGYGVIGIRGRGMMIVSRVVMLLCGHVLQRGDQVLHACHNPPCCNPAHLRIGTNAENSADKVAAGRQARGVAVARRGAANGMAKLNEAAVREISAAGGTHAEIAFRYGVSDVMVSRIKARKAWRHIHRDVGDVE